jgi:hypothetical protein
MFFVLRDIKRLAGSNMARALGPVIEGGRNSDCQKRNEDKDGAEPFAGAQDFHEGTHGNLLGAARGAAEAGVASGEDHIVDPLGLDARSA